MRAIITDSTTLIKQNELENVFVLPVEISIDDKTFRDGIDIESREVLEALDTNDVKTSLPSMRELVKVMKEIESKNYDEVLVLVISSKLSGTYNAIRLLMDDHCKVKYNVVDTKTISVPLRFLVEYIYNECQDVPLEEMQQIVDDYNANSKIYITPDNLKYLVKGGRLGHFSGVVGDAFNIKPIIELVDGEFKSVKKCRGKLVYKEMIKLLQEFNAGAPDSRFMIAVGTNDEDVIYLDQLTEGLTYKSKTVHLLSPSVCVHIGPKIVGLLCVKNPKRK